MFYDRKTPMSAHSYLDSGLNGIIVNITCHSPRERLHLITFLMHVHAPGKK